MQAVASPIIKSWNCPQACIVEIIGKQEDLIYCFRLAMQSTLAEQKPADQLEKIRAGGNLADANQQNQGKRSRGSSGRYA